ncbi:ABC transporter permease [Kaistia dalseonensis]|uniref:Polar amino acid transport system permease protein n=1 Tax=Kaistia dalseonensis TaxID=410840 RepID=A0ABU0H2B5_9HYPH|nr:ABC transporter permease [Kaistia dalseonensis]MCX5493882.1 ABC transporter permease [Kaistia dalseonensis]MDQ0436448.1 polar amino acid transport system permease protein [Kaistia dalseonensis]
MDLLRLLSFGPDGWGDELLAGTWLTIRLAIATLPFGLAVGFVVALAKRSENRFAQTFGNIFTTVFRGLPELLTIFIVYFGGQILLQRIAGLLSDGTTAIEVSGFVAGMIALGLVFSAYASEVFLGAFRNITRGQYEAAYALGLRPAATLRLVIIPQLVRLALPGLANLWLILLKDTSLVSVIALDDLLRMTGIAVRVTKEPFFFFGIACLIYLAMSIISSFGIGAIERWSNRGLRKTA